MIIWRIPAKIYAQIIVATKKPDSHPCSAYKAKGGFAVDAWLTGGRCMETDCEKCGDQANCVSKCQDYKRANGIIGYPTCEAVCNEVSGDYKCWVEPETLPTDLSKPQCYPTYPCSKQYCSGRGGQQCSARDNYIDPWKCLKGDPCKRVNCKNCGDFDQCVDQCDEWKTRRRDTTVDCNAVCKPKGGGNKCFVGCKKVRTDDDADFMDDILALDMNVNKSNKYNSNKTYVWGVSIVFVLVFIFALYRYSGNKFKQINESSETTGLLNNYGSLNA